MRSWSNARRGIAQSFPLIALFDSTFTGLPFERTFLLAFTRNQMRWENYVCSYEAMICQERCTKACRVYFPSESNGSVFLWTFGFRFFFYVSICFIFVRHCGRRIEKIDFYSIQFYAMYRLYYIYGTRTWVNM